jgi:predicted acylesterase/phospholipase RssA
VRCAGISNPVFRSPIDEILALQNHSLEFVMTESVSPDISASTRVAPSPRASGDETIYEIGLVMAGAISAGAYTAGVVDFLIEALDEWCKFNQGRSSWLHEVKLRVISGASAGGMTGSIVTAAFGGDFPPVHQRPEEKSPNPLYHAWVQQIDIKYLLESRDLDSLRLSGEVEKQRKIRKLRDMLSKGRLEQKKFQEEVSKLDPNMLVSLLDSTQLRVIADEAVKKPDRTVNLSERRPYLPDPFQLYLSISNLRGVPYLLELEGGNQRMITHADFMHFALTAKKPDQLNNDILAGDDYVKWNEPYTKERSYAFWLDPNDYTKKNWKRLSAAALATGAFPFGLAPVKLDRLWEEYKYRKFPISTYDGAEYRQEFRTLVPEPMDASNNAYNFICVDGGLLNNAPFDLAHRVLTGDPAPGKEEHHRGYNERHPTRTKRSIILIAPFPDPKEQAKYQEPATLLGLGNAILGSLMTQVRFNPEELILAADPNVGSRHLISPVRSDPPYSKDISEGRKLQGDIACGTLGGFGGFLSEDFRHHDFMLGRRNCQRFLEKHFVLPDRNPLFSNWDDELKRKYYVDQPQGANISLNEKYLPIIPLVRAPS